MVFTHRKVLLSLLLIAAGLLNGWAAATGSAAPSETSQKRRWKVIILVPETHLSQPRIPDPAVETELSRQLIDAGYKVLDDDRIKQLRYSDVVDRIVRGGPDAIKDALQLCRRFGADVLVTGEAFSQVASRQTVQTDLGPVTQIRCRARVELKAIRMDSGEKFYADAIQKTGTPEPTEELSSKACLQQAAAAIAPSLLDKCDGLSLSDTQRVELQVRGLTSFSQSNALIIALEKLPGVKDVDPGEFNAHTLFTEVQLNKDQLRAFPARLETDPALKRFHITVQSVSGTKIICNSK
jgi:hypothetical protein